MGGARQEPGGGYTFEGAGPEAEAVEVDTDKEIARLAKLRIIDYERERKTAAEKLGITRISVLDEIVGAERKKGGTVGQGKPLELPEPELWQEPVDGAALLDEIEATVRKFIVCDNEAPVAGALWIASTWYSDVVEIAPILNLKSPEPRCGKTIFLNLIERLACRPLSASSISPAALYRSIEKVSPTLILDEADATLTDNEELRGVINSGHARQNAFVIRSVGDDHEPKRFSTWGFKAIAGIGKRAFTIEDRSISICLKRKMPHENIARLRHASKTTFETLARKLARWSQDNKTLVAVARPTMPEALNDRQQDCWEPLFAIAQAAGDTWAKKVEIAALHLCGASAEVSSGSQLLMDIRNIFEERGLEQLSSEVLTNSLLAISGSQWPEANRGRAITQNWLARRLRPFGVHPKNIGPKHDRAKGYTLESCADAFARYIPPGSSVHPDTTNENNGLDEIQSVHPKNGCTDADDLNPLNSNEVRGCTDDLPPAEAGKSANGHGENEAAAPEQSDRIAAARRILAKAQDLGIPLLVKDGELMREAGWVDESFLSEIRENRAAIIAKLQNSGGAA
jgi:putative DNA primase/helicase